MCFIIYQITRIWALKTKLRYILNFLCFVLDEQVVRPCYSITEVRPQEIIGIRTLRSRKWTATGTICSETYGQTCSPKWGCVWFKTCWCCIKQKHTLARKNLRQSKLLDPSPQAVSQTHREFVDGLLSECRLKVRALSVWPWMLNTDFSSGC